MSKQTAEIPEQWIELRCVACVPLGWDTPRLLFRVQGEIPQSEAKIEIRCHRCKSVLAWQVGTVNVHIKTHGQKNQKRATVVFE